MTNPATAVLEFAQTMEKLIDEDSRRLVPPGRTLASRSWTEHRNGTITLTLSYDDESGITGTGGGKLDALADAARKLGRG